MLSEEHEYPNGQQVLVPHFSKATSKMLVLIGEFWFLVGSCWLTSQVMGWIFSQVEPFGQHSAVVLPANGRHDVPVAQQKLLGRPEGQELKLAGHCASWI